MNDSVASTSTGIEKVEMMRGRRRRNPMVVEVPIFLLLLLGNVNGFASHRTIICKQQRPRNNRPRCDFWPSLPLHYAIDSTRLIPTDATQNNMSQNLTFPLILSDDGHSIQPLVTTSATTRTATATATSSNVLSKFWRKIKEAMKFDKQAIAKLGIDFGLTYNMISNVNGSITLSTAWYIASMKTGISPLAPGNWRSLLAAYASLYVVAALIRPFRIAFAIGVTHKMEHFLQYVEKRIGCTRTNAIGMVFAFGIVLWLTCCAAGVTLASTLAGVPLWKYD